jgi:hypothetical protein
MRVVLFTGGRGSEALAQLLGGDPRVHLTLAINGYDDGASTGEVRRFLVDALGPSDFRKNASRFARMYASCDARLIDFLDARLPAQAAADALRARVMEAPTETAATSLRAFLDEYDLRRMPLRFEDASVGNFVFAGCYLRAGRRFNDAIDRYCALVGLPPGLVENVTDGANAVLVALDADGRVLGSEEEIVDARRRNRIAEIFLIDRVLDEAVRERLARLGPDARRETLLRLSIKPGLNARLTQAIATADLIVYAPGTQHSSLFPSYLTAGLGPAIAANVRATKLFVTNLQVDAEIAGSTAVELIDRAVFYLRDKGRLPIPAPFLFTHYLLNDPAGSGVDKPYVPLGRLESLEDPRLVRIANFEAGTTGRHDARKVLAPYIEGFVARAAGGQRIAVLLGETRSLNKVSQTLLEMVRGGILEARNTIAVFHHAEADIDPDLQRHLQFPVRRLEAPEAAGGDRQLRSHLEEGAFQYLALFDSSGMYNGEDLAALVSHLTSGRLDAVWGSRRLSIRDIQESIRLRYRDKFFRGTVSAAGSQVLSLQCLFLFGRYVSDTLSGARAVRARDALGVPCRLTDRLVNQHLLVSLLGRRAEILELPVQFVAIGPDQVRRTTVLDGLRSIAIGVSGRWSRRSVPRGNQAESTR